MPATAVLRIDERIKAWIAPLEADEYALLEESVTREGCRDALVAWGDTLIDGHHRHVICEAHGIPYQVIRREFIDRDHVEIWVRENQAGRRNLTDDQRAVNAAEQLEAASRIAMREQRAAAGRGNRKPTNGETAVVSPSRGRSRAKAAKTHRVSERRVRRVVAIKAAAADLIPAIVSRTLSIKEAEREIRKRDRTAKRTAAVEAAKAETESTPDERIRHEAFTATAAQISDGSVALVFTDPPYHDKTLPIYADLGRVAARVLKPGGSLITYTSHHRIPEVISMLQAGGLTFFWPLAMVHTGQKARMTEYGIVVHWKPLLWFVKGTFRSREDLRFVNDLIESAPEKDAHPWQQGTIEARYYIEALTQPGDLVFDPFCGGGTTAVAAAHTQRRWLTCDIDEEAVWIARQRLREVILG